MTRLQPNRFPDAIMEAIALAPRPALDDGEANEQASAFLADCDLEEDLFEDLQIQDQEMARACLAGLWLKLNELSRSHKISKELGALSGAYWHGILHRRELDFENAKYWFHEAGDHPALPSLLEEAQRIGAASDAIVPFHDWDGWDADQFVDFVDEGLGRGDAFEKLLLEVQEAEWLALFQYSFDMAIGRDYSEIPGAEEDAGADDDFEFN
jgi:hypothetical protein